MSTEKTNQSEELSKEGVEVRPANSEVLIIGCQDRVALDLIKAAFGQKFKVFVMNKDIFNKSVDEMIRSFVKWEEDQKVAEYCTKPENIQNAMQIAHKIQTMLKESGKDETGWFVADDIVDNTNFTYKQARSTMEMLFTFGFVAQDIKEKKTKYMIIADPRHKLKYMDEIIAGIEKEHNQLLKIREEMVVGITEAETAISELSEESKESLKKLEELAQKGKSVEGKDFTKPDLKIMKKTED